MADPTPHQFGETLQHQLGIDPNLILTAEEKLKNLKADDRYSIIQEIARGGMGRVLMVFDNNLKRIVAMKLIDRTEEDKEAAYSLLKFIEEAQVAAQLEHPNILSTYDVGVDKGGNIFFTMRMIQGDSLRSILDRLISGDAAATRQYTLVRRLQIFQQTCNAIAYAHSKGVIHRDIKPENIMLGKFGEVFVMDWGLAKILHRRSQTQKIENAPIQSLRNTTDVTQTIQGTVAGTPMYMSPEQARGEIDYIDRRSDIYGLGALLFEIISLERSVHGESAVEMVENIGAGRIRTVPPSVPRELAAIIAKAMQLRPEHRYQSVEEISADIQAYLEGGRGTAWRDNMFTLTGKWVRRHRGFSSMFVLAIAALSFLSLFYFTRPGDLMLTTEPDGAAVTMDGRFVGLTPLKDYQLRPGRYRVLLSRDGYDPSEQEVYIGAGSKAEYAFVLRSEKQAVSITTDPAGATIRIVQGPTLIVDHAPAPLAREIKRGRYTISFSKAGFDTVERAIDIQGGGALLAIHQKLEKNSGTLMIDAVQKGIGVLVRRTGASEVLHELTLPMFRPLELSPGTYALDFALENHYGTSRLVELSKNHETRIGVMLPSMTAWQLHVEGTLAGPPVVADLNGDRIPDVVAITTDGHLWAFSGLDGTKLWDRVFEPPADVPGGVSPLLVDLDQDGLADVVVALRKSIVAVSGKNGSLIFRSVGEPTLRPVAADGNIIAVGNFGGQMKMVAWNGSGSQLWEHQPAPTVMPAVGEGIVFAVSGRQVRAVSIRTGAELWMLELESGVRVTTDPAVGDLDGDGKDDLLVFSPSTRRLYAISGTGRLLYASDRLNVNPKASPVLGKWDEDAAPDAIFTGPDLVVVSGRTGETIFQQPLPAAAATDPSLVDIDGVVALAFAASDSVLRVLSDRGTVTRLEYRLRDALIGPPTIADMNGDGEPDLVVATRNTIAVVLGPSHVAQRMDLGEALGVTQVTLEHGQVVGHSATQVVALDIDGRSRAMYRRGNLGDALLGARILGEVDGEPYLAFVHEAVLHGVSGRTGAALWELKLAEGERAEFAEDLNGDEIGDITLWSSGGVRLVSGKDGKVMGFRNGPMRGLVVVHGHALLISGARTLERVRADASTVWRAEFDEEIESVVGLGDVDGDGEGDVAVSIKFRQLTYLVSGRTGAKIGELHPVGTVVPWERDVDDDGVADVMTRSGSAEFPSQINVYSSKTGAVLLKIKTPGVMSSTVVAAGPWMLVVCDEGGVRRLCAFHRSGELAWSLPLGRESRSTASIAAASARPILVGTGTTLWTVGASPSSRRDVWQSGYGASFGGARRR